MAMPIGVVVSGLVAAFSIVWRASVFCLCGGFPGFRFLVCVATSCFGLGLWGLVNW